MPNVGGVAENVSHESSLKLPAKHNALPVQFPSAPNPTVDVSSFGWSPQGLSRMVPNKRRRVEPQETPQKKHVFPIDVTSSLQQGKQASNSLKYEASEGSPSGDGYRWAEVYSRPRIIEADFTPLPPLDAPTSNGLNEREHRSEKIALTEAEFTPLPPLGAPTSSVVSARGEYDLCTVMGGACFEESKPPDSQEEAMATLRSLIEHTERRHARVLSKRIALEAKLITSQRDEAELVSDKYRETITVQGQQIRALADAKGRLQRQCALACHEVQDEHRFTAGLETALNDEQVSLAKSQASFQCVTTQLDTALRLRDTCTKYGVKSLRDENTQLKRQLARVKEDVALRCGQSHLDRVPMKRLKELRAEHRKLLASVNTEHDHRLQCVVCMDARANVTTAPCAHSIMCEECLSQLTVDNNGDKKCPMCRTVIERYKRQQGG